MTKKTRIIGILSALILISGLGLPAQEQKTDQTRNAAYERAKSLYEAAKKNVYDKNYAAAVEKFKELAAKDYETAYGRESFYWLGYSLDKMAASLENIDRRLEMKKEAIERLDQLLKKFPENVWAGDARILQVQIADELVRYGLNNYRSFINGGIEGGVAGGVEGGVEGGVAGGTRQARSKNTDPDLELKLVALDALMGMDEGKAFPILEKMVRSENPPELREKALFVLSQSDDEKVGPILASIATKDPDLEMRKKAVFWLGQKSTPGNIKVLKEIIQSPSESNELKEHAVFAVSQLPKAQAVPMLIEIVQGKAGPAVREKALFWLGQSGSSEAARILKDIVLSPSESDDLKEKAVFAVSQLPKAQAVPMLIEIAKSNASAEVRKKAVFWLGQSNSPEAAKFLRELIEK